MSPIRERPPTPEEKAYGERRFLIALELTGADGGQKVVDKVFAALRRAGA